MDLKKKTHIVMHHSLTKDSQTVSWSAIRDYHVKIQKWRDVGYQYGIEIINGQVEILVGRLLHETAAAVKEATMNTRGVHVMIVGNFDLGPPPISVWNKAVRFVAFLAEMLQIPTTNVTAHNDYAKYKSCPGTKFNMVRFRAEVDAARKEFK